MTPNPQYPNYPHPDPALVEHFTQEAAYLLREAHAFGITIVITRAPAQPLEMGNTYSLIEVFGQRVAAAST